MHAFVHACTDSRVCVHVCVCVFVQMIGRAGRPQFDREAVAVVLCQESKKGFLKRFLYSPFPVESCLHLCLPEHLNAEIVAGTIQTKSMAVDYLSWTYFFRYILGFRV